MTVAEKAESEKESIAGIAATAAAQAMSAAAMTAVGLDVSAGHMNPAVTIGLAAGGYVTVVRCVLYVIAQVLGSSAACLLLRYIAGGLVSMNQEPDLLKFMLTDLC